MKQAERANFKQDGVNKSFLLFLDHYSSSRFRQEQDKDRAFMSVDESKKLKSQEEQIYMSKLITIEDFEDFYYQKLDPRVKSSVPLVLLYSSAINNSLLDLKSHAGDAISHFNFDDYRAFKKEKKLYDFHDLFNDTITNMNIFEEAEVRRLNKKFGTKFAHQAKENEEFSYFRLEMLISDCVNQLKLLKIKYPTQQLQKEEAYVKERDALLLKIDDLKRGKLSKNEKFLREVGSPEEDEEDHGESMVSEAISG